LASQFYWSGDMPLSLRHKFSRLPKRLPVGSTFVIEGRAIAGDGEKNGHLQVFSRFIVLPGGHRIELGGDPGAGARNRRSRGRGRQGSPAGLPARTKTTVKSRAKKIMAKAGTTLRHCR
jgi:hypothetical protein